MLEASSAKLQIVMSSTRALRRQSAPTIVATREPTRMTVVQETRDIVQVDVEVVVGCIALSRNTIELLPDINRRFLEWGRAVEIVRLKGEEVEHAIGIRENL